jgi:hypothetical protein
VLFRLVVFLFYVLLVDFILGREAVGSQLKHLMEFTVILYHRYHKLSELINAFDGVVVTDTRAYKHILIGIIVSRGIQRY